MTMRIINFCVSMVNVRGNATDAAPKYLMTHMEKHKANKSFQRETKFECHQVDEMDDKKEGEGGVMLNTQIHRPNNNGRR